MNKSITKYLIIGFAYLAVLYPLWVRFSSLTWAFDSTLLFNLFPMFGLAAFAMLWLHSLCGVFEPWLRQHIDFDRFVRITATLIFVCILAHPLLLFAAVDFSLGNIFLYYASQYIWAAAAAWLLLISYDITKPLKKKYDFFARHWNKILIISNIGFIMTFFHSLALGSDLQSGHLRLIWMFYGITAILALVYTYGIKRFLNHSNQN